MIFSIIFVNIFLDFKKITIKSCSLIDNYFLF